MWNHRLTCIAAESGAHKQAKTDLACPSVVLGFDAAVTQCEPTLRVQGVDGKRGLPVLCRLQQAQAQGSAGSALLTRAAFQLTRDGSRHRHKFRVQSVDGKRSMPVHCSRKAQAAGDELQVRHPRAPQGCSMHMHKTQRLLPLHSPRSLSRQPTAGASGFAPTQRISVGWCPCPRSLSRTAHSRGQRFAPPQRTSVGGAQSVRGSAAPSRCGAPTSPRRCGSGRPPASGRPGSTTGEHRRA